MAISSMRNLGNQSIGFFGDGFGMNVRVLVELIEIKVLMQQPTKRGALTLLPLDEDWGLNPQALTIIKQTKRTQKLWMLLVGFNLKQSRDLWIFVSEGEKLIKRDMTKVKDQANT